MLGYWRRSTDHSSHQRLVPSTFSLAHLPPIQSHSNWLINSSSSMQNVPPPPTVLIPLPQPVDWSHVHW
ncbi:hypothetical protein PENTCL1PPCAC_13623 [Pristionchus entomophagus]|uniref:Uncharacterized protein n=1 Tax=Pristionchus entomophagus TaxID=358040 RepID=A0AAV5TBH8_9BILA|nr:hypothetical protein PENTCL1PPCAC_13623 [Pristionchus entomophagus]